MTIEGKGIVSTVIRAIISTIKQAERKMVPFLRLLNLKIFSKDWIMERARMSFMYQDLEVYQ